MTTRRLFLENSGFSRPSGHYAFNRGGVTFVVLNGCYNAKGEAYAPDNWAWDDARIPAWELAWLKEQLAAAEVRGVLEANSYAVAAIYPSGKTTVTGYRKAESK